MVDVNGFLWRVVPVNQAQIGINDTPITRAIEEGQFKLAQQLILENTDRSYLDEGPFVKIPLTLVLSGDPEFRKHPRHLELAKLLVEHGANPNLRIPTSELQWASPSPMEHLINLLSSTRDLLLQKNMRSFVEQHLSLQLSEEEDDVTNPLRVIGLNGEDNLSAKELRKQLLILLDIFLANGGDPNIITSKEHSTLYHIVLSDCDPDVEVVMKLCEAGGNLNIPNGHRTTPLMDLILYADGDAALDILNKIWTKNGDISSMEAQNYCNETALWRAMLAGSPQLAVDLLRKGADPAHRAEVYAARWWRPPLLGMDASANGVSALYAPLLQQSSPYKNLSAVYTYSSFESRPQPFDLSLMNKVMACALYPVVDNTHTSELFTPQVVLEMQKLLFKGTKLDGHDIVPKGMTLEEIGPLLFGNLKAGLQQLCIRQIMHHIFFQKPVCDAFEVLRGLIPAEDQMEKEERNTNRKPTMETVENWEDDLRETSQGNTHPESDSSTECLGSEVSRCSRENSKADSNTIRDHWNLIHKLSPAVIHELVVAVLRLPTILVPHFVIEAVRLQLGTSIYTYEHVDSVIEWEGMSYEGSTDEFLDDLDEEVFVEYGGVGDNDDDDDDDSDYHLFPRNCHVRANNSFSFLSSSSSSSSSSEDEILFPVMYKYSATDRANELSLKNLAGRVSFPLEDTIPGQSNLVADGVKSVPETGTPVSDNCSSESLPSNVQRNEYEELDDKLCSTSSSDTSTKNTSSKKDECEGERGWAVF